MDREYGEIMNYDDIIDLWKKKNIQTAADLDAVVNGQAVSLIYHSTKIEEPSVSFHDTREIFDHGRVTGYTGDVRALFALQNAKAGWELFLRSYDDKAVLSQELIKEFHYVLTSGTYDERRYMHDERPGEYKKGDYVTGKYEIGAVPEDVPDEMQELIDDVNHATLKSMGDVLTAASFFHAKLENIHPFADGNGRTGRLLMNYYLVSHSHPVIIIHEEDRRGYMEALEAWDSIQDLDALKNFLREQTVKTWEKHLHR